jgi:hypothetical protein
MLDPVVDDVDGDAKLGRHLSDFVVVRLAIFAIAARDLC